MAEAGGGRGPGRRRLPAMHRLLATSALAALSEDHGRAAVHAAASQELARIRATLGDREPPDDLTATVALGVRRRLGVGLRRVVNATGVVLHTGLGRAPLADEALTAVVAAAGYCNLELDLGSGRRGQRSDAVAPLLRALTGAEDALVVNNNAAAVLLVLSALAAGREVVVSRGELVEIGGGFRIPEVLAQSGCRLREVGTTNRSHLRDYEAAVGPDTALLLKVHPSNFRVVGFQSAPALADLAALAARHGLPLVYDLGSGRLSGGDPDEPAVPDAVRCADIVACSGDKLLGGPQAGILCGRAELVRRCAAHPLHRAVRVDKLALAALQATLRLYATGAAERVPAVAMLATPEGELQARAEALAARLRDALGASCAVSVRDAASAVGGGASPTRELRTAVVALRAEGVPAAGFAARLRRGNPPVVARVAGGEVVLDMRTVGRADECDLERAVAAAAAGCAGTAAVVAGGNCGIDDAGAWPDEDGDRDAAAGPAGSGGT